MKASTRIVSGTFFGATIEPGTFHGEILDEPRRVTPPDLEVTAAEAPNSTVDRNDMEERSRH